MKPPKKTQPPVNPDEPVSVVCSPLSQQPVASVPASQALCGQCRQPVWLSYSSLVALGSQPYECICTDCIAQRIQDARARGEPIEVSPPTPLQRAEIAEALDHDDPGGSRFRRD